MGSNDAIFKLGKPRIFRRLLRVHVKSGTGDCVPRKRIVQRILVNNPATRTVDQPNRRFHHLYLLSVNHIQRLLVFRYMDADVISFFEDPFKFFSYFNTQLFGVSRCRKRVVAQDFHIKSCRHLCHRHTDSAQPDKAEHLAVELISHILLAVPGTAFKTAAGRHNVSAHRKHQG